MTAEGNARTVGLVTPVLLVLLAVQAVTVLLGVGNELRLHEFVGLTLAGPVLLKLGTVGWRFVRYYRGRPEYRAAGAPVLPLRLMGPLLVVSTVTMLGSGATLLLTNRDGGPVLLLHQTAVIVTAALLGLHVLVHLPRAARLVAAEARDRGRETGLRAGAVLASLALGAGVAAVAVHTHPRSGHDQGRGRRATADPGHRHAG